MSKISNTEEFIAKAKLVAKHNGKNYNYSRVRYKTVKVKVEIICPEHGPFLVSPNNHLNGKGCPHCSHSIKLTNESVDARLLGRDLKRLGVIAGNHNKCLWKCLKKDCWHEWSSEPNSVLLGTGCPKCARKSVWTNEKVDAYLEGTSIQRNGDVSLARDKILWKCLSSTCQYEWKTYLGHILKGTRCPVCAKKGFNPLAPAVIYVYRIDDWCGYGITNNFKERDIAHKRAFRNSEVQSELIATFECSGIQAQEVERLIKKTFEITNTGIPSFKREATHVYNLPRVLDLINSEV